MIEVAVSETILAPAEVAFREMSRVDTLHEWLVGCVEAWPLTDDPYRVGGKVGHIDEVLGQRFEVHYEVVEWEEPSRLAFQTLSGGPFEGTSELLFTSHGDETVVEITVRGRLRSALRFGEFTARTIARKQLAESVNNAKAFVEGKAR